MKKPDYPAFLNELTTHYREHGRRELPWRIPAADGTFDPYHILVSELMLQQTQVPRVIPKYHEFLDRFPDVGSLAAASLGEVLTVWSGLGYNRRAKFLWQAAQAIVHDDAGVLPTTIEGLVRLPGVGRNTAGAILAYAFNQPAVFIETNIRTVYIHHFFADSKAVTDALLRPLIERTLDQAQPRLFYWMLMDYGSFLKKAVGNVSRRSKHFTKQSAFQGSARQIRGAVIRLLTQQPMTVSALERAIADDRLPLIVQELQREGLISGDAAGYRLS